MTTNLTPLEQLRTDFQQWRQHKIPGARIPQPLRERARTLCEHYGRSQIARALNISGKQLNQWCQTGQPKASTGFVALPASTPLSSNQGGAADDVPDTHPNDNITSPLGTATFQACLANGTTLSLCGALTPASISALAKVLV